MAYQVRVNPVCLVVILAKLRSWKSRVPDFLWLQLLHPFLLELLPQFQHFGFGVRQFRLPLGCGHTASAGAKRVLEIKVFALKARSSW
ncbi:MAG: hypothetical protein IPL72_07430 [Sulfuritalea sp.]|nr:hypothetical protein [Sulfuritalea sp.]